MRSYFHDNLDQFINDKTISFLNELISLIRELTLDKLLREPTFMLYSIEPYNIGKLVTKLVDYFIYSRKEELITGLMRDIVVFIIEQEYDGKKSELEGVDLEYKKDGIYYLVSIRPKPDLGKISTSSVLESYFKAPTTRVDEININIKVQPVIGIICDKSSIVFQNGVLVLSGQSFWTHLINDDEFHASIINTIIKMYRMHNEEFLLERNRIIDRFSFEMYNKFCDQISGQIKWEKLVEFTSGELNSDQFLI